MKRPGGDGDGVGGLDCLVALVRASEATLASDETLLAACVDGAASSLTQGTSELLRLNFPISKQPLVDLWEHITSTRGKPDGSVIDAFHLMFLRQVLSVFETCLLAAKSLEPWDGVSQWLIEDAPSCLMFYRGARGKRSSLKSVDALFTNSLIESALCLLRIYHLIVRESAHSATFGRPASNAPKRARKAGGLHPRTVCGSSQHEIIDFLCAGINEPNGGDLPALIAKEYLMTAIGLCVDGVENTTTPLRPSVRRFMGAMQSFAKATIARPTSDDALMDLCAGYLAVHTWVGDEASDPQPAITGSLFLMEELLAQWKLTDHESADAESEIVFRIKSSLKVVAALFACGRDSPSKGALHYYEGGLRRLSASHPDAYKEMIAKIVAVALTKSLETQRQMLQVLSDHLCNVLDSVNGEERISLAGVVGEFVNDFCLKGCSDADFVLYLEDAKTAKTLASFVLKVSATIPAVWSSASQQNVFGVSSKLFEGVEMVGQQLRLGFRLKHRFVRAMRFVQEAVLSHTAASVETVLKCCLRCVGVLHKTIGAYSADEGESEMVAVGWWLYNTLVADLASEGLGFSQRALLAMENQILQKSAAESAAHVFSSLRAYLFALDEPSLLALLLKTLGILVNAYTADEDLYAVLVKRGGCEAKDANRVQAAVVLCHMWQQCIHRRPSTIPFDAQLELRKLRLHLAIRASQADGLEVDLGFINIAAMEAGSETSEQAMAEEFDSLEPGLSGGAVNPRFDDIQGVPLDIYASLGDPSEYASPDGRLMTGHAGNVESEEYSDSLTGYDSREDDEDDDSEDDEATTRVQRSQGTERSWPSSDGKQMMEEESVSHADDEPDEPGEAHELGDCDVRGEPDERGGPAERGDIGEPDERGGIILEQPPTPLQQHERETDKNYHTGEHRNTAGKGVVEDIEYRFEEDNSQVLDLVSSSEGEAAGGNPL